MLRITEIKKGCQYLTTQYLITIMLLLNDDAFSENKLVV